MRYEIITVTIDDNGEKCFQVLGETDYLYEAKYRIEEIIARNFDHHWIRSIKLYEGNREIGHVVMTPTLTINA